MTTSRSISTVVTEPAGRGKTGSAREVRTPPAPGLVVVDKPAGLTSHDVVARVRRMAGTRKVGHAGTLDPMATGVLLIGVERATKLLGHLALTDKAYAGTIRLGESTVTDDAEGEVVTSAPSEVLAAVGDAEIEAGVLGLTGAIDQVPSSVSAIKVDGRRSYARVRAGESVELAARRVMVSLFDVVAIRRSETWIDLDVQVECSTGTYVRALARDLGDVLGVGGHLTALRRTRVGPFVIDQARGLETLTQDWSVLSLASVVELVFGRRDLGSADARTVANGGRLALDGETGPVGVFAADGQVIAVMEPRDGVLRPLVVLAPA